MIGINGQQQTTLLGLPAFEHCNFSDLGNASTRYIGGFYDLAAAKSTLTIGGTVTVTHGTVNYGKGSRVIVTCQAASAGATVLTITGRSISDAGVLNAADSEILIADCSAISVGRLYQSTKRWNGQITLTLSGGGAGNALSFNYGFVRSKNMANQNFTITSLVAQVNGAASETGFDIKVYHHKLTGWTYSAAAFVPPAAIYSFATDNGTDVRFNDLIYSTWKRTGLATAIAGKTGGEGFIVAVTTTNNNSVRYGYVRLGVTYNA